MKKKNQKKTIRELVNFEYHILYLNLVGSNVDRLLFKQTKADLVTACDETIWMSIIEPTKEHSWSQFKELLK